MGRLDEAIESIVLATKLNPKDASLYAYEYYLRKKRHQFYDALIAINNALSIDPNNEKYIMYRDEIIKSI